MINFIFIQAISNENIFVEILSYSIICKYIEDKVIKEFNIQNI